MKRPNLEEQREILRLWEETASELTRIRQEALRGLPYNWKDMDTLLSLCDSVTDIPPRKSSGVVEMQRWFMGGQKK